MVKGKLHIGIDFVALLSFFYLIDHDGIFIYAIIAAAIHEAGHILAMKFCGIRVRKISLGWYGARIDMDARKIISYKKEIVITLAGPILGAICAVVLSRIHSDACIITAGFSAVLTIFNLLPAGTLDGGRALKYTALLLFDDRVQSVISKLGNLISAGLLVALCIYISVKICVSPSLCIFCTFVSASLFKELFE